MTEPSSPDNSLLKLFRQEAENHTTELSRRLIDLENDLSNTSFLQSLMRSAHSLKGAARIIGLTAYSQLAHELENVFVAAQEGRITLKSQDFDVLLKATDFLAEVVQVEEIFNWPGDKKNIYDTILNDLKRIHSGESAPPASTPTPPVSPQPSIPSSPPSLTVTPTEPILKPDPTLPDDFSKMGSQDASIRGVFSSEVLSHANLLEKALTALKQQPDALKKIDTILVGIAAIKGTSIIAQDKEAIAIAEKFEEKFNEIKKAEVELPGEAIDIFINAVGALKQIAAGSFDGAKLNDLLQKMGTIAIKAKVPSNKEVQPTKTPPPFAETGEKQALKPKEENVVRISAANLSRIMGLAAESVVETRKFKALKENFLKLKSVYQHLIEIFQTTEKSYARAPMHVNFESIGKQVTANVHTYSQIFQSQLNAFDDFSRKNHVLSSRLYSEVIASKMRPFSDVTQGFPRLIRNLSRMLGKAIQFNVIGGDTPVDRDILDKLEAPLNHIIRNACDHGIESPEARKAACKPEKGLVELQAYHKGGMLLLKIKDDGKGINVEAVKKVIAKKQLATDSILSSLTDDEVLEFLFLPGFSMAESVTEISGRGVGLDVVKNLVQEVGGNARIETEFGKGTTILLQLPITRSVVRTLTFEVHDEPYAIPLSQVNRAIRIDPAQIKSIENHEYFQEGEQNVPLIPAQQVLGFEQVAFSQPQKFFHVIVLGENDHRYSIMVDRVVGETELVLRPLDHRLGKVPCVSAASITDEGTPILILDPDDLMKSIDKVLSGEQPYKALSKAIQLSKQLPRVLVVDDSPTVRETERQLLENAGYIVHVAVDGLDGWNTLCAGTFNLVVTDIDMPRMNGFEFINLIKNDPHLKSTPVVVVTYKDREGDRKKALQAGAAVYLQKTSFRDETFIKTVQELIAKEQQPEPPKDIQKTNT